MCFFQPVEYSNPNIQKLDIEFAHISDRTCLCPWGKLWRSWEQILMQGFNHPFLEICPIWRNDKNVGDQKERKIGLLIFHLCAPGRAWALPFFTFFIIAYSNPGSLQHLLSLMPQKNRKRRPLPGIFYGQYVVVMWTQYCLNVANDSWQPLLQDVTF